MYGGDSGADESGTAGRSADAEWNDSEVSSFICDESECIREIGGESVAICENEIDYRDLLRRLGIVVFSPILSSVVEFSMSE